MKSGCACSIRVAALQERLQGLVVVVIIIIIIFIIVIIIMTILDARARRPGLAPALPSCRVAEHVRCPVLPLLPPVPQVPLFGGSQQKVLSKQVNNPLGLDGNL